MDPKNIITIPSPDTYEYITTFERIQILQFRTKQLDAGAKTTLSKSDLKKINNKTSYNIASLELKLRKIPVKLKRKLPDGSFIIINVNKCKFQL